MHHFASVQVSLRSSFVFAEQSITFLVWCMLVDVKNSEVKMLVRIFLYGVLFGETRSGSIYVYRPFLPL